MSLTPPVVSSKIDKLQGSTLCSKSLLFLVLFSNGWKRCEQTQCKNSTDNGNAFIVLNTPWLKGGVEFIDFGSLSFLARSLITTVSPAELQIACTYDSWEHNGDQISVCLDLNLPFNLQAYFPIRVQSWKTLMGSPGKHGFAYPGTILSSSEVSSLNNKEKSFCIGRIPSRKSLLSPTGSMCFHRRFPTSVKGLYNV